MCRRGIYYNLEYKRTYANFEGDTSPLIRDELEKNMEKVYGERSSGFIGQAEMPECLAVSSTCQMVSGKGNGLKSCVIVLCILRDLRNRVPRDVGTIKRMATRAYT